MAQPRLSFGRVATACALLAAAMGCAGAPATPLDVEDGAQALSGAELQKTWIRLSVPYAQETPNLLRGPDGYVVLSRELVGGKALTAVNNYLYRSDDGVRWTKVPIDGVPEFLAFRGLTRAGGRYVMVGSGHGRNEVWTSAGLGPWSSKGFDLGPANLAGVTHTGDRFFALGTFRQSLSSTNGADWTVLDLETLQPGAVAFGNGRYVLVGSGPIQVSMDGVRWQATSLDCALPGACITDPDGGVHQGYHPVALFVGDRFYVDRLVSSDGTHWQVHGEPIADAYVGGYLFASSLAGEQPVLRAWKPHEAAVTIEVQAGPPIARLADGVAPATVDAPLPGGETCATHRCVIVGDALYLVR